MSASNYTIDGKRIDQMPCLLCGEIMEPVAHEMTHHPHMYTHRGQLFDMCPGNTSFTFDFLCHGCYARIRVERDNANVVVTEPAPKESWEYVIMSVSSVKYGRVKNLGNYETERLEAEVVLEPGQSAEEGVVEAKRFVKRQLDLGPSDEDLAAARQLLEEAGEL